MNESCSWCGKPATVACRHIRGCRVRACELHEHYVKNGIRIGGMK